jgi:hypothetical protein
LIKADEREEVGTCPSVQQHHLIGLMKVRVRCSMPCGGAACTNATPSLDECGMRGREDERARGREGELFIYGL